MLEERWALTICAKYMLLAFQNTEPTYHKPFSYGMLTMGDFAIYYKQHVLLGRA